MRGVTRREIDRRGRLSIDGAAVEQSFSGGGERQLDEECAAETALALHGRPSLLHGRPSLPDVQATWKLSLSDLAEYPARLSFACSRAADEGVLPWASPAGWWSAHRKAPAPAIVTNLHYGRLAVSLEPTHALQERDRPWRESVDRPTLCHSQAGCSRRRSPRTAGKERRSLESENADPTPEQNRRVHPETRRPAVHPRDARDGRRGTHGRRRRERSIRGVRHVRQREVSSTRHG